MKKQSLTIEYILLQIGFWCCNILEVNFAGVYLLERGYTNGELGIILALGNLAAFLLGPVISSFADKRKSVSPIRIAYVLIGAHLALLVLRLILPMRGLLLSISYLMAVALLVTSYSMALRIYSDYGHSAYPIRYGLSRAAASTAMGILCLFMGGFVTKVGTELLTYAAIGMTLLQILAYILMERKLRGTAPADAVRDEEQQALSLGSFIKKNSGYSIMLLGVVLLFIAHNMFYSFSITVMEGVGGDETSMGIANALAVFLEIPAMLGYSFIAKGRKTEHFMLLSFLFFFIKNLFFALAGSVYGIYFAILFQTPSFALYSVASVEYASETIARSDSTKAQSLAYSVAPVGNVAACLIGGFLFDGCGSRVTMAISAGISLVGMFIAIIGLKRTNVIQGVRSRE